MKRNHGFFKGALFGALIALSVVGLASCGVAGMAVKKLRGGSSAKGMNAKEKMELLEQYVDAFYTGEVDEKAVEEGLYKGYIQALGDPYSVYYDEEETKTLKESTSGEYIGLGAVLSQDVTTGEITILQVYEGSPAQQAGIRDNDQLYKVDGEVVTGEDVTKVASNVRGEKGTQVEITVLRGEEAEEITVTATRDEIEMQTVEHELMENQVGYLRVTEFNDVTYDQYKEALQALEAEGMQRLIVDLRGNPGGNLDTVTDVLDLMLPEGVVVSMKNKQGDETEFRSDEEHQFTKPLVVLVDEYSASASEIYSGAIQDFGTGVIVGTQTFGKGVVQRIFDLKDGTCLKLTIAEYFTPSGRSINEEGLKPDVEVEYEPNEEDPNDDNQLEKAIEVVNGL